VSASGVADDHAVSVARGSSGGAVATLTGTVNIRPLLLQKPAFRLLTEFSRPATKRSPEAI
jgi:hypothetical protein